MNFFSFFFHPLVPWKRGPSSLEIGASSGTPSDSNPLVNAVARNRIMVLPTKSGVNHHCIN
jgi:hypothetical protein